MDLWALFLSTLTVCEVVARKTAKPLATTARLCTTAATVGRHGLHPFLPLALVLRAHRARFACPCARCILCRAALSDLALHLRAKNNKAEFEQRAPARVRTRALPAPTDCLGCEMLGRLPG